MHSPLAEDEHRRLKILRDLQAADALSEAVFGDLIRLAAIACDTPIAVIGLVDEEQVWFKARIGLDLDQIPRDHAFCSHTILQPGILTVIDPVADDRFAGSMLVTQSGVRFYAGAPLVKGDHRIGAIAVMDRVPHLLTAEQVGSLEILARRVVHELQPEKRRDTQAQPLKLVLARTREVPTTILLVEDDDNLRRLLERALEAEGFSVVSAADGAQAVRMSVEYDGIIDLVISDVVMPGINGTELPAQIRAVRPEVRFMFITGLTDDFPQFREAIKLGIPVLEKPFLCSELVRKVEATLKGPEAATGTGE